MSDEALENAMAPINEWIESRSDWPARAAEFIDNSALGTPPWTAQECRNQKALVELSIDS